MLYSHLEIVNYTFSVQEVVRNGKEVPVECFVPVYFLALQLLVLVITFFYTTR